MVETATVDSTGAAAAKLAGLRFSAALRRRSRSAERDSVAAINDDHASIESLVSDGLPGVVPPLTRTASNMNAAADVYAEDRSVTGNQFEPVCTSGLRRVKRPAGVAWSVVSHQATQLLEHTRVTGHDPAWRDGR